jgi:hypothetical protein
MDSRGEMVAGKDLPGQLRLFDPEAEPAVEIKVEPAVVGITVTAVPAAASLKRCRRCGCEKPLGEFAKSRGRKDGLSGRCRACSADYHAERTRKLKAGETVARKLPRGVHPGGAGKYRAAYRGRHLGTFASVEEAADARAAAEAADPMGVPTSAYRVDKVLTDAVHARYWFFDAYGYLNTAGNAGDMFLVAKQHHFVWRLAGGSIPDGLMIDHVDHSRANNTLANLRLVTKRGNNLNRRRPTAPKLLPGGRWQARVARKHLGMFDTEAEAQAVINAHVAGLIEQETVVHGADLLASYMATTQATAGSLTTARAL